MGELVLWINLENVKVVHLEIFKDLDSESSKSKEKSEIKAHSIEIKAIEPTPIVIERAFASLANHEEDHKWN